MISSPVGAMSYLFSEQEGRLRLNRLIQRAVFCLYVVLVFFISFDGLRDSTIFFRVLSFLREGTILVLFVLALAPRINVKRSLLNFGLILLCICYLYGSLATAFPYYEHLRSISGPITVVYRHAQFLMLILVFSRCARLSGRAPLFYLGLMVWFQLAYTLLTPLIYYFPPFFMREGFSWWGRIGVGYPTMDAQIFCFSLVAVICLFRLSAFKFNAVVGVLTLGVLMQVTGTGLATLMCLFIYITFFDRKVFLRLLPSFCVMVCLIALLIIGFYDLLEKPILLAMEKLDDIANLGGGVSTDTRKEQLEQLMHLGAGDNFRWLFGMGAKVYVENQYSFFLVAFGIVGVVCFMVFLVTTFLHGATNASRDNRALMLAVIVFALSSYTLVTFYLYPMYAALALFIAHSLSSIKGAENYPYAEK